MTLPFHRVQRWTGRYFHDAWLRDCGVCLLLGHDGNECPSNPLLSLDNSLFNSMDGTWTTPPSTSPSAYRAPDDPEPQEGLLDDDIVFTADNDEVPEPYRFNDDAMEDQSTTTQDNADDSDPNLLDSDGQTIDDPMLVDEAPTHDIYGNKILLIVHSSGMHHIGVRYCFCDAGVRSLDSQLLLHGLYPASMDNPSTAFTFDCLDDFHLDNLEAKTVANTYMKKIRHLTNPFAPHRTKVFVL